MPSHVLRAVLFQLTGTRGTYSLPYVRISIRPLPLQRRSLSPSFLHNSRFFLEPPPVHLVPRLLFAEPPIRFLNHECGIRTPYNRQHNWSSGHRMGRFVSVGP